MNATVHTVPAILLALCLSAGPLAACGGSAEETNIEAVDDETTGDETPVRAAAGRFNVTLLEAGAEPRRPLRYTVPTGITETATLELAMSLEAAIGEASIAYDDAPVRIDISIGPVEGADTGRLSYEIRVTGLTVGLPADTDEEVLQHIAELTAPLRGMSATHVVDERGISHEIFFTIDEGVPAATATLLANIRSTLIAVPLPAEAVGEGARWEVTRPINHGAFTAQQTVTYTITGLDEEGAQVQTALRQTATPHELGSLAGGATARLDAFEASATGTVEIEFAHTIPQSELQGASQQRSTIISDEGETAVRSQTRITVRVQPVPDEE